MKPHGTSPFSASAMPICCSLSVRGSAKRAPNTFAKPTCKLPVLDILAVAIHKAGIMGLFATHPPIEARIRALQAQG